MLPPGAASSASTRTAACSQSVFGYTPGFGYVAAIIALTYLWLPFMLLPIYAGLERLPSSLLEASGDLGAKPLRTFTSVIVPMLVPSIAAGSIFTFSLSLGDYITPRLVTEGKVTMIGNLIYTHAAGAQPTAGRGLHDLAAAHHRRLPAGHAPARRLREPVSAGMRFSFLTRLTLRAWMILTLVFLYLPLAVVASSRSTRPRRCRGHRRA